MPDESGTDRTAPQYLHTFESPLSDRKYLGGKGASLARMTGTLGLPVPPGFTITTEAWKAFAKKEPVLPDALGDEITLHLVQLGARLNKEMVSILHLPIVQERLAAEIATINTSTPEQFGAYLKSEIAKWTKAVQVAGIQPE